MHQLNVMISLVTVNGQLQRINTASARRDQRNDRATQARGEGIDVDTKLLFLRNVEHVERHDAGDAQLQQLQRQIKVTFEIGSVDHVDQQVRVAAKNIVAGNLLIERGLRRNGG